MDLRRALTTAAVAAVLTPVVLVTASTGYAAPGTEGDATSGSGPSAVRSSATPPVAEPSGTPDAGGTEFSGDGSPATPTGSAAPSSTRTANPTPTPGGTATTTPASPDTTVPPSDGASPPDTTPTTPPADATSSPSVLPSGTTGASPSPSSSPGDDSDRDVPDGVCDVADFDVRIEGLPATVPAGSTTEPFTVVLDNTAGADAAHVQFGLSVAFRDGLRDRDWLAAQQYVSVRYFDWGADAWGDALSDGGIYTYADLEAGKRYEMRLRLVLAPDTPPGAAGALAFSTKWTFERSDDSACVNDNEWYRFEITPADTAPATAQVRPQGGRAPEALRPGRDAPRAETAFAEGALARTGSGPDLRLLVLASGAALALGSGALVIASRRRS